MSIAFSWAGLPRTALMGILNVTADSFSDGGVHLHTPTAIEAGGAMHRAGADLIDVGGESTRPGAAPVDPALEQRRILPVIAALAADNIPVSVDTRHAATMQAALSAGAVVVNDVSGGTHDPASLPLIARAGCSVVLMHMRGTPETMAALTDYEDVAADVAIALAERTNAACAAGIDPARIAIDPGIGFAKTAAQNLDLLRNLARFTASGFPVLVGASRKGFIGQYGREPVACRRDPGSIAAALFAVSKGARILRVHDVPATLQALRIWQSLSP